MLCRSLLSRLLRSLIIAHKPAHLTYQPVHLPPWRKLSSAPHGAAVAVAPSSKPVLSKELPTVVLRPYQKEAIAAVLAALSRPPSDESPIPPTRVGVSSPTGSGKTTMFVELSQQIPPRTPQARQTLVIVNGIELATQAKAAFERGWRGGEVTVEIDQGQLNKASGTANVTIATYQTLLRPDRLRVYDPSRFCAIIIDEAHHAAAKSYIKILRHFDRSLRSVDEGEEPPEVPLEERVPIVGFSATFSRHDGMALGKVFQEIVYHKDFLDMINEKWLCEVVFTTVQTDIDLSSITLSSSTGDYNPTSLSGVVNTPAVRRVVLAAYLDRCRDRKSTLVFCADLAHVRDLTDEFRRSGIDARYLHAGTPAKERKELLEAFRQRDFPVLLNCAILTEGADIPGVDCVILARPTRSRNLFSQMIGRGMRLAPGKANCLMIDIASSLERVGNELSTGPALEGLDPDVLPPLESITSHPLLVQDDGPDVPDATEVTYTDFSSPAELLKALAGNDANARAFSVNAWVDCGKGLYVLDLCGSGTVRLERTDDGTYNGFFRPPNYSKDEALAAGASPFRRPIKILSSTPFSTALRACDTFASSKVDSAGRPAPMLHRNARWRQAPASAGQLKVLTKRLKRELEELEAEGLTKGEAANALTRLTSGGKTRMEKEAKEAMREAEKREKTRQKKERTRVRVGKLDSE